MIFVGAIILAAALSVLFKNKIDIFIPLSIIGMTTLTYVFAVLGVIKLGLAVCVAASVIGAILLIYKAVVDRNNLSAFAITPGLVAFCALSLFFILFSIGADASGSPDSTFWVRIAKGIYYYDDYQKGAFSKMHPQFIAIWGYLSMKTWRGWADGILVASNNILLISLFMPLFSVIDNGSDADRRSFSKKVFLTVGIFILPYISDSSEYAIYASDMIMGVLLGMSVVLFALAIRGKGKLYYCSAILYLVAAVGTKRIAVVLAAILLGTFFYLLIEKKEKKIIAIYTIAPMLAYCLFKRADAYPAAVLAALIMAVAIYVSFKRLPIRIIVGVIGGCLIAVCCATPFALNKIAEKYYKVDQPVVLRAFGKMLVSVREDWFYVGELVKLPILVFIVMVIVSFAVIYYFKRQQFCREELVLFGGELIFAAIYILLLLYLYLTKISTQSGGLFQESLLGLARYMKIIPVVLLCYIFYVVLDKFDDYRYVMVFVACLGLTSNLGRLTHYTFISADRADFSEVSRAGVILDEDITIAYIDMGEVNRYRSFILNEFPCKIVNVDELSYTYRRTQNMEYVDKAELESILSGCDYLYVYYTDDQFANLYGTLFADYQDGVIAKGLYTRDNGAGLWGLVE